MRYPKERKEAVLKKMLPPNHKTIREIAREEGISEATLYHWRKAARAEGGLLPDGDSTLEGWSAADKFSAAVETAAMNEVELSEYCRKRGLYPARIQQWREACEQANDWDRSQTKRLTEARKAMVCLEEGLEDVLALPEKYRRRLKSTNMQERLIQEVRRREWVIRIFPNEASAHRLIGVLLAEIHEEWQGRRSL